MAMAACERTSCTMVTESGFGMDYSADLCVSHTTGPTWCKNHHLSSQPWFKLSVAELSDAANNYCGELLGAVIALLILCAALEELPQPLPHAILFCNNRGVLSHRNRSHGIPREAETG
jgi:hypothetical protein